MNSECFQKIRGTFAKVGTELTALRDGSKALKEELASLRREICALSMSSAMHRAFYHNETAEMAVSQSSEPATSSGQKRTFPSRQCHACPASVRNRTTFKYFKCWESHFSSCHEMKYRSNDVLDFTCCGNIFHGNRAMLMEHVWSEHMTGTLEQTS
jgi:hypothetical protein